MQQDLLKIVIWGTGTDYQKRANLFSYYSMITPMEIVAYVSKSEGYKKINDIPVVSTCELKDIDFDAIFICSDKHFKQIYKEILGLGIDDSKIINSICLLNEDFDVREYLNLKKNVPTIISNTCLGGLLYSNLFLPFRSPFINMSIEPEKYILLLKNFSQILDSDLQFSSKPDVFRCMMANLKINNFDVPVSLPHSQNFDIALADWNRRIKRIDFENLIVLMVLPTENDYKIAEEFSVLPFDYKYCFTAKDYNIDSCVHVKGYNEIKHSEYGCLTAYLHKSLYGDFQGIRPFNILNLLCKKQNVIKSF